MLDVFYSPPLAALKLSGSCSESVLNYYGVEARIDASDAAEAVEVLRRLRCDDHEIGPVVEEVDAVADAHLQCQLPELGLVRIAVNPGGIEPSERPGVAIWMTFVGSVSTGQ
ncbi:hypothetical protein [Nocardioides limicola]|uniref:hypothetical protein n=1 Tax=Nocardioides limicola TaxID=2803368 RepID=UPI00193C78FC|nr:hypothetical protein [Nocardioides sp. DJM-14]